MKTLRLLLIAPLAAGCLFYSLHSALAQNPAAATPLPELEGKNLLTNGAFQAGMSHWQIDNFGTHTRMEVDPRQRHDDHVSLRVMNSLAAHTFVRQIVMGKANTHYRLSGFIMTKDVKPGGKSTETGAVLMVGRLPVHTPLLVGTQPWTPVSVEFTTTNDPTIRVGPSLGTDASFATGTAWFAELKLVEVPAQGPNAGKSGQTTHPSFLRGRLAARQELFRRS